MRFYSLPLLASLLVGPSVAQTPVRVAPPVKSDPKAPENTARTALIDALNKLAASQTAARRDEIARITTPAQARARQAKVRAAMLRLLGPLPAKTALNPQITGETSAPGIRIQKLVFDSQPDFHVTALLYTPDPLPLGKLPAIIMAPGHSPAGKAGDFAFAAAFTRAGFAVLSYDPIGQGERLQYPDPADPTRSLATRPTGEHGEAGLQPVLLGESVAKYFLWDGIRAVDYLETRAEIDPKRIGAFGCSGGGSMTALLGALDPRIAATGTACYLTSFDTLLPSIGPQDGEQSTPGWIAAGLDFSDWVEIAAPKPYAIIATESDMFPFAGAQTTEAESRRFYGILGADQKLAFLHGPGGHGNLRPILPQILAFFTDALSPTPPATPAKIGLTDAQGRELPPPSSMQVTGTGQVATSYPGAATVYSLNLAHGRRLPKAKPLTFTKLQQAVRSVTGVSGDPAASPTQPIKPAAAYTFQGIVYSNQVLQSEPGIDLTVGLASPLAPGRYPAEIILTNAIPRSPGGSVSEKQEQSAREQREAHAGNVVLWLSPRPSPQGSEELKSPILGPFYLLGLRAELVGKTLLGMRVEDTIRTVSYLSSRPDVDPTRITAEASGHEALVLLHAAILDTRLKHITLHDLPPTYAELLADPLPKDAPQDILPGVLLHYDIPDLIKALGSRVSVSEPTQVGPRQP